MKEEAMDEKIVFICSPYGTSGDLTDNTEMAKRACRIAVESGYVPYAPHLFFPQFLPEEDPEGRERGIRCGLAMLGRADEMWVVGNCVSEGMAREIAYAAEHEIPITNVPDPRVAEEHLLDAVLSGREEEIGNNEEVTDHE